MLEGKFMCEMSNHYEFMEVGKIYEFKKGVCVREDGSFSGCYSSLGEFHHKNPTVQIAVISPKSLLETGVVVEYQCGEMQLVINGSFDTSLYGEQKLIFISDEYFMIGSNYDDNLVNRNGLSDKWDIVKIYKPDICSIDSMKKQCNESNLIWQRPVPKPEPKTIKMTLTEVATKLGLDENTKLEIEM